MSTKKKLLSGIMALVMCFSLIVGSTLALFTSESTTNIAVTSGTVNVQASLTLDSLFSPDKIELDGVGSTVNAASTENKTFANGGTVIVDGASIQLVNMTPGDKAIFKVTITNRTNVAFMQRLTFGMTQGDAEFFSQLLVGISDDGEHYTYYSDFATAWENGTPIENDTPAVSYKYVSIEMPGYVENKWQNKTCTLTLNLSAVQGNTNATDAAVEKVITVADADTVAEAINTATDGAVIFLNEPAETISVSYTETKTVTLRGYHIGTLTMDAPEGTLHVYNNVDNLDAKAVAQSSLHIYGEVDNIVVNEGRVVIENTAKVEKVELAPKANTTVHLVIPEKKVEDKIVVGEVNAIVVPTVESGAKVNVTVSPEVDTELSGEGADSVVVEESKGGANSYVLDEAKKALYIGDAVGLRKFADDVSGGKNYSKWTVYLTADIDLSGENWTPIGPSTSKAFCGTFDGQGHTISNMSAINDVSYGNGFFKTIVGGSVKNVTFDKAHVSAAGADRIKGNVYGIVAGYAYGTVTFENVHVKNSDLWGFGKVGGILGMAADASGTTTFKDCSVSDTTIAYGYNAGGLAGLVQNQAEISNCSVSDISRMCPSSYVYVEIDDTLNGGEVAVNGLYWEYPYGEVTYYYTAWSNLYNDYLYGDVAFDSDPSKLIADGLCHN